jgi:ATP-binding cassette subfamily B protein
MIAENEDEPPPAEPERYSNGQLIRRLLQFSWRYRSGCILVLSLHVVILAFQLGGIGFAGLGIDYIRHQVEPEAAMPQWPLGISPPPGASPLAVLLLIAGLVAGFAALRGFLSYICAVQTGIVVQRKIVVDLRTRVYDKLQRLGFRFYDENDSSTIINRVTKDVQSTRMFIDGVIVQVIVMAISLCLCFVYMVNIHLPLTLACLATTPLLWFIAATFSRAVRPAYMESRARFDRMILVLSENLRGIPVLKGFAREPEAMEHFREANESLREQNFWIFNRTSSYGPAISFLSQVNLVILLGFGGYLVITGKMALGTGLVVFASLLQLFSGQVAGMVNLANNIQDSLTAARRVFEILDTPMDIQSVRNARSLPSVAGHIQFENVGFEYTPGEPVLSEISFEAQPEQCIAILGETGAGKSTLLSLIPRFYDPVKGAIRIDGHDLRALEIDDLRRKIGIVFQEGFLFSNSVAQNIAFAHPEAGRAEIERAAKIAAAHDFIMDLPDGYETILGESGSNLSGGQRQRLAIARAILLQQPILLLDDPTAAIDPETEHEILESMEQAMRGRTTFVVAHRLSTLRRADHIIVLEQGRIVQEGTHRDLMDEKGSYRQVAELQLVDPESKRLLRDFDRRIGRKVEAAL